MSNQSEDEPLPQLSPEEFEALRASIRASRKAHNNTSRIEQNANKIAEAEYAAGEEGLEIGLKVWQMRKAGWTPTDIRKTLKISPTVLSTCLREFELRVGMEAGRQMDHYRLLDDERIEDMMKRWLPIATEGILRIERMRAGEVFTEIDFDRPLKASYWVLHAMKMRLQLLAAARPDGAKEGQTNILVWLQGVLPGIQKVVQTVETPPQQTLILETEAEK